MNVQAILQRLETEQAKLARSALEAPSGKDAFEYGRACGMYAGLEQAKRVLLDLVSEKNRKDEIL